jgi:hypothetical protein
MIKRSIHGGVCEYFEEALNTANNTLWHSCHRGIMQQKSRALWICPFFMAGVNAIKNTCETHSLSETVLETISKPQIAFEGKAGADDKAQHTREYVSILKRPSTQPSFTNHKMAHGS